MKLDRLTTNPALSMLCSCNDLFCVLDGTGRLYFSNASMKKQFQFKNPQTNAVNLFHLLSDDQANEFKNAFQRTRNRPASISSFLLNENNNGSQFTWSVIALIKDLPCELFVCGAVKNKTVEKNSDIQSRQFQEVSRQTQQVSTDRLQYFSKLTSDAVWEWDIVSGHIIRNDKLIQLIGDASSEEQTLGWWIDRIHPEDRNLLTTTINAVTEKKDQSWQCEYRFLCADGEYKNMLDRGFIIYENSKPQKMIGSLHDITNEKLMQNLLMEERLRQFRTLSENSLRVQEEERSRFGRELHDNVNQILSAVGLYIGMLNPAEAEGGLVKTKALRYTQDAIDEIRRLSREMITPQLEGDLLVENIQRLVDDVQRTTTIRFRFKCTPKHRGLSPGKKITLFRIVQEQVKNILKYSKATKVELSIDYKDPCIHLLVKDNGVGFDVNKTKPGIGLNSIRERTKFYNGKTIINSTPGKGTTVQVDIPLL